jgi:hypothetical protein
MVETWKTRLLLAAGAAAWVAAWGLERRLAAQDCNCNGRIDSRDIAEGWSADCNRNGIPDECELVAQTRFTPAARIGRPGTHATSLVILDANGDGLPDLAAAGRFSGIMTILENGGERRLKGGRELRLEGGVRSLAAADLDGDGREDLAACVLFGVSVILAGEDGAFRERRTTPVDSGPVAIAAGDIDGDGAQDLVTANSVPGNQAGDNISVLINEGGGAFRLAANHAGGKQHTALVVEDLDGDGLLDIAAAAELSRDVSILFNRGAGAFSPAEPVTIGFALSALAAGDLDGDGKIDLAAAGREAVAVVLNGGGSFLEVRRMSSAGSSLQAHDLDGDGNLDIVLAGPGASVGIIRNFGDARFSAPIAVLRSCLPAALRAADLDGDGAIDLALAGSCIDLLWNRGDRGFDSSYRLSLPWNGASSTFARDVDLDGKEDLVVAGPTITSYLSRGKGTFAESRIELERGGYALMADLDGDSHPDLAVALPQKLSILWSETAGSFSTRLDLPLDEIDQFSSLAAADLDGDGEIDLAAGDTAGRQVIILLNHGERRLEPTVRLRFGREFLPGEILAEDLDADGRADLVIAGLPLSRPPPLFTLWNLGGLAYESGPPLDTVLSVEAMRARDVNGNGNIDLIVAGASGGQGGAWVFQNLGGRMFSVRQQVAAAGKLPAIELADLDGDGDLDMALADEPSLRTLANRGDGGFEPARVFRPGASSGPSVAAGDLDGDGILDLAWRNKGELRVAYEPWNDEERLRSEFGPGRSFDRAVAADFDGDGRLDLVAASAAGGAVAFYRSEGVFEYAEARLHFGIQAPTAVAGADLDGDGREELICADRRGAIVVLEAAVAGGLAATRELPLPARPAVLEVADLDGDGDLDLAVACDLGTAALADPLVVLWNVGDGSFAPASVFSLVPALMPASLQATDLDGDGRLDLAVAGKGAAPHWLRSAGEGRFEAARSLGEDLRGYSALATADLDGGGAIDLLLGNALEVQLLRNAGGGVFERAGQHRPRGASSIQVVDVDADGALDFLFFRCVRDTCQLVVRWGRGGEEPVRCGALIEHVPFAPPADFDGDGHLDLLRLRGQPRALEILAGHTAPPAADRDRNGIIDECEHNTFHRGDATGDGRIDISDPAGILGHLFLTRSEPACLDAADANADRRLDIADAIHLLLYLFRGGAPPPSPGPPPAPCGSAAGDPGEAGSLGCREYTACP